MIFLVTSGNTIMMFLGWELIGLTSFFLINFWTTKTATLKSAFKAFTFNKVSDFFMFMFLVSTYSVFYTFDITALNNQAFKYEALNIYIFNTPISYLEFISIMLLGAAFIKSAQLGGHV
jgi:NADH-ubiquinone oxidoreductase chain 5